MSVHVYSWSDLQQYGINALTGESCAYSMRLLCDLNEDGVALMRSYFGMSYADDPLTQFSHNWNSTVNSKPSIASIMLPRWALKELARFAMFSVSRCTVVTDIEHGQMSGYSLEEATTYADALKALSDAGTISVYRNYSATEAVGGRNQHAFTGRTT